VPFAIAIANILISNALIQHIPLYQNNTSNRILVFAVIALSAYALSQFFIGIYAEAIKSIFVIRQFHGNLLNGKDNYTLAMDYKEED
jgi:hypothetical protein